MLGIICLALIEIGLTQLSKWKGGGACVFKCNISNLVWSHFYKILVVFEVPETLMSQYLLISNLYSHQFKVCKSYSISSNSFLVTVHTGAETIQGRKLFKGGNYSRKYGKWKKKSRSDFWAKISSQFRSQLTPLLRSY